jgi:hypothetical protein
MEAAGLTDLHFHDLRGTAITLLADAGCSVPEIAPITGHNYKHVNHIHAIYLSRTGHLADAAIIKLDRHLNRIIEAALFPRNCRWEAKSQRLKRSLAVHRRRSRVDNI